jgi:hypothetical protein
MLTRRNALLLPALAVVSACQRPTLYARIAGPADAAAISVFSDDGWYGQLLGPLAIVHVAIHNADGARETMWEISAPRAGNVSVRSVQYGVLPPGFTQSVAPRELSVGVKYELTVTSRDYNHGVMYFVIANGRVA